MLTIDLERQLHFAALSGDYNPMHVDLEQARRSQFGGLVVHGVHVVLAALAATGRSTRSAIIALDAQFRSAVMVGDTVSFDVRSIDDVTSQVLALVGGRTRAVISVTWGESAANREPPAELRTKRGCERRTIQQLRGLAGSEPIGMDGDAFDALFPTLAPWLDHGDAAALLATTRVVGMRCPGEWALFRQLRWTGDQVDDGGHALNYAVSSIDERFAMVRLAMRSGGRRFQADVIVREPPPVQLDMKAIRAVVPSEAFKGLRALVVGGSRGLGELTVKVFVAGGAEVLLTYRTGSADAERVVTEVGGAATSVRADTGALDNEFIGAVRGFQPNHVSFMATPPIGRQSPGSFDAEVYRTYLDVYATGLADVLTVADASGDVRSVFMPSSVYAHETPAGFAEYSAAKRAAEALCEAWASVRRGRQSIVERLPPLVTDQTAAILGTDASSNIAVLLPALLRLSR